MSKQEKKQQRIYNLPKQSKKIGVSLWPPSTPNLNPLDYTTWDILENKKKNAISHPSIGL